MSQWVETPGGELVNLAAVARAVPSHVSDAHGKATDAFLLFGRDGESLGKTSHDELWSAVGNVVPASAGCTLLSVWGDGDDWGVDRYPIVAWHVFNRVASPVTVESQSSANVAHYILAPTGEVIEPECSTWPNEETWLRAIKARRAIRPKDGNA